MRAIAVCVSAAILLAPCSAAVAGDVAWDECVRTPKRGCVLDDALRLAQSIDHKSERAIALAAIAKALPN